MSNFRCHETLCGRRGEEGASDLQREEDWQLGIGWRDLDFPKIASLRTQLGPDIMGTDGLPSRKLSIRRKRKERRRLIKY